MVTFGMVPDFLSRHIIKSNQSSLYLRTLSIQDATDAYLSWLHDPTVNRFLHLDSLPSSTTDLSFYIEKINASPVDVLLGLFDTLTDLHIGNIKIGEINWKHSFGEIGILIGERDFQQRGYATSALQQTIGLAFEELKLYKLIAGIHEQNKRSIRLFEKHGFCLEGSRRSQYVDRAGNRFDGLLFGLFNPTNQ